jgi:cleavage and polyadenylation specificity factor subunit 3
VGSLAAEALPAESQLEGVLVSRDYTYALMDPNDLPQFTDLVVTNLNQKQKIFCRAPIGIIKWHLENMYGTLEYFKDGSFRVFDTVTVYTSEDGDYLSLEWKGDAINDMIADSVLAIIIQSESIPASVKATKSSHSHDHTHDHLDHGDKDTKMEVEDSDGNPEIEKSEHSVDLKAPTKSILEGDVWIKNVSTFLSNHFGTDGVKYTGISSDNELLWKIQWDEYEADVFIGQDGKGVRVVSTSIDTHKRVTGIMNRVFKTMRPLEETWCLVAK